MSDNIKDGGPAFPGLNSTPGNGCAKRSYPEGDLEDYSQGLSLRDYFAAHIMQGLMASLPPDGAPAKYAQQHARLAFILADAMINERNR